VETAFDYQLPDGLILHVHHVNNGDTAWMVAVYYMYSLRVPTVGQGTQSLPKMVSIIFSGMTVIKLEAARTGTYQIAS